MQQGDLTSLEAVWAAWLKLSRADRCKFLARLRSAYAEERAAMRLKNGYAMPGVRVTSLADLTVSEMDLQRLGP